MREYGEWRRNLMEEGYGGREMLRGKNNRFLFRPFGSPANSMLLGRLRTRTLDRESYEEEGTKRFEGAAR